MKHALRDSFGLDLADDITWHLLPLGIHTPIDPIEYIAGKGTEPKQGNAIKQFLSKIAESTNALEAAHLDTARLLTVFSVKLESTKKIGNADVVVGIQAGTDSSTGPLMVTRSVDPNVSHPLRTTELVEAVSELHGQKFTTGSFQAIAWKHGIKLKPNFCWQSSRGEVVKYSHDAVTFIKRLTSGDIDLAKSEYKARNRKRTVSPVTASLASVDDQQVAS